MTEYTPAMPHGSIAEVFPDVFFVTGTMRGEFFGSMWQFSRNMTVIRENGRLTILNSVRLDDAGLEQLRSLGEIAHVVRLGDMHGIDDPFYVDTFGAEFWAVPKMGVQDGLTVDHWLTEGGELPVSGASLFCFETTTRPESILLLEREGGIAIACDALQNWVEPDEFFLPETVETMKEMGFFAATNLGPAWVHGSEPKAEDFKRLKEIPFEHALCGHGTPVISNAATAFRETFQRAFGV